MSQNNAQRFRDVIAAGRTALGTVVSSHDSAVSEMAGDAGFDFIWIDMEHSPMTIVDAMHHVMAVRGTACAPLVRVAANLPHLLKPVLDLGPAGIIVPMVNDAAAAAAVVTACRYPMQGGERGLGMRRNCRYGAEPMADYLRRSAAEPLVIVQIEHKDAVQNIDAILAVPGVDSICIGPFDLSCSYGKPGLFDDPEVTGAIDRVREKTLKAGVLLGGFCQGPFWQDRFMNWKTLCDDAGCLFGAFRRLIEAARSSGAR